MEQTLNAVWKFVIDKAGTHQDSTIMLPRGAKIIKFGYQIHPLTGDDGWFLWAVVNPDEPTEERKFVVVGTGTNWSASSLDHVMTSKDQTGLVWHLLEWRTA